MANREKAAGRLSLRLTLVFGILAGAPWILLACFLLLAGGRGWMQVSASGSTALVVFAALLSVGGGLSCVGLWYFLRRRVSTPLSALLEGAALLGEGDFAQPVAVGGPDELAELAGRINRAAERLAEVHGGYEQTVAERTLELTRALGERQLLQKLNEAIVHNIPNGVAILSRNGGLLYFNSAFERMAGVSPERLGQSLQDLVAGGPLGKIDWGHELRRLDERAAPVASLAVEIGIWPHRRELRYALFPLPPSDLELPLRLVGEEFCLKVLAPPDCDHNCDHCIGRSAEWVSPHALLMIEDTTEQRRMEAQLIQSEKLAALGQLSAGVAHEMRNPLSAIYSAAFYIGDVLTDEEPDLDGMQEYVALIQRNVDRAQRTVTDILNFARPSGPDSRVADLSELVSQTVAILDKSMVDQGVTMDCELAADVLVRCKAETVKQALLNLIVNGLQAMPEGGTLTLRAGWDEAGRPRVMVRDTGTGIPPEHLHDIFNPFFSTKPAGQGTGLGLSIARQAIEADNGRLEVESVPGEGTTFSIFLRPAEAVEGAAGPAPARVEAAGLTTEA